MKNIFILVVVLMLAQACNNKENKTPDSLNDKDTAVAESKKDIFLLDELLNVKDEAELISIYGEENVTWDTAWYPEGLGTYMVSTLFRGTDDEVSITWSDTLNRSGVANAEYMGKYDEVNHEWKKAKWRTSDSIRVGLTVQELEQMNGKPFTFSGFGWDYGGIVLSWKGGNLEKKKVGILLAPGNQEEFNTELLGDQEFSSANLGKDKTNIIAVRIHVYNQQ